MHLIHNFAKGCLQKIEKLIHQFSEYCAFVIYYCLMIDMHVFHSMHGEDVCLLFTNVYQVEAQLDYGPGSEIGAGWKIGVTWSENGVSRWRRPNSDIYSQNHHFGLVYDMIYQFLGMEAKNYKFGMFCQQCHPSVASGDADIRPRNASRIHTCHLFMS